MPSMRGPPSGATSTNRTLRTPFSRRCGTTRSTGKDRLLVKALINAIGVYPIGTLVILDTMEMAVVSGVNNDPDKLHQPSVKVISDSLGVPVVDPPTLDLSEIDPATGKPARTIIKTTDPERYGVQVSDYLI